VPVSDRDEKRVCAVETTLAERDKYWRKCRGSHGGQSRADFISKISIAYKEARETTYWLRLLKDTGYLTQSEFDSIHADADELCRLTASIQKTSKQSHPPNS
jgi:hypothetical protein